LKWKRISHSSDSSEILGTTEFTEIINLPKEEQKLFSKGLYVGVRKEWPWTSHLALPLFKGRTGLADL